MFLFFLSGFNILIWSREEMVMKKQEHLLKAMTEQGIGSRSLSRRGGQRQANPGTSKLKAKLLSWEVEEMGTKTKDSKSQGRKWKGKDRDNWFSIVIFFWSQKTNSVLAVGRISTAGH